MYKFAPMNLMKRNKVTDNKETELSRFIVDIKSNTDTNRYNALFIALFAYLRPAKNQTENQNLKDLLVQMDKDKAFQEAIQKLIIHIFNNREIVTLFTNVGLSTQNTFFEEFTNQLKNRFLPPISNKRSINHLLQATFYRKNDWKWIAVIPKQLWMDFFARITFSKDAKIKPLKSQLSEALVILSIRVSYLGLEKEFNQQSKHTGELNSPFIEQNKITQSFVHLINHEDALDILLQSTSDKLIAQIEKIEQSILKIRSNTSKNGTSLGQSFLLVRTEQQISRMRIIIKILTPGEVPQKTWISGINLFRNLIYSINTRNSILILYKQNIEMLAYQIAEHKSESGEHYITSTKDEYVDFFFAAVAGGAVIVVAALLKALLHMVEMAMFWQYFCYGLNYAIAFVVLFVTGASLATKQPAMTASALASSLDSKKSKSGISLTGMAITFAKVWRSQFAAFMGNLIVVFPLSYIVAVGWHFITGTHLLHDSQEALSNLRAQNPTTSLAWVYACITGVLLFISGIITGYFDNKATYSNIGPRIASHPTLKRFFSGKNLKKSGDYIERNLGGIIGNICLGFMLGFAGMVGHTFGIPFDIRHITISTAYFGFGIEGMNNNLSVSDWVGTTVGVIGIGFLNFAVSFSLAFFVAMRSRKLSLSMIPNVMKLILRYFIRYPIDFIYPPKVERKESDIFRKNINTEIDQTKN